MTDRNSSGALGAFLGGALLGYVMTTLLAPQSGADLRKRLRQKLSQHSILLTDSEIDEIIARFEEDDESII